MQSSALNWPYYNLYKIFKDIAIQSLVILLFQQTWFLCITLTVTDVHQQEIFENYAFWGSGKKNVA